MLSPKLQKHGHGAGGPSVHTGCHLDIVEKTLARNGQNITLETLRNAILPSSSQLWSLYLSLSLSLSLARCRKGAAAKLVMNFYKANSTQ